MIKVLISGPQGSGKTKLSQRIADAIAHEGGSYKIEDEGELTEDYTPAYGKPEFEVFIKVKQEE